MKESYEKGLAHRSAANPTLVMVTSRVRYGQEARSVMQRNCDIMRVGSLLLVALLCYGGCSSGDDRPSGVPAEGVVRYKGEPVEGADIAFSGEEGKRSAFGRTDDQGRFDLTSRETREGIPPGKYRVKMTQVGVDSEWNPDWDPGKRPQEVAQSGIPKRYGSYETSELTASVAEDGPNEFEFELTD